MATSWTPSQAADIYGLSLWGDPFFRVSDQGETEVNLGPADDPSWHSLPTLMQELQVRGIDSPVMFRFGNILQHHIRLLNESFRNAIRDAGYPGEYRGVFPIKVNQQHQVIEQVCDFGAPWHHGLEAGSKPELIAALGTLRDPEALVVCNGYKDREFVDLALYGSQMGLQVLLVVEAPGEVPLILERAAALGIRPRLGVRMKLSAPGSGKWFQSGGDNSVFGLNTEQVIDVVDRLREAKALDTLELLHYHIGSQIPDITVIRNAVMEVTRVYAGLVAEGAPMGWLDLGGGLAVDYDGTQSNSTSSRNYSVQEYCADVVEGVMEVCASSGVKPPNLVTESGRATIAHYGALVFNILDVNEMSTSDSLPTIPEDAPLELKHLGYLKNTLSSGDPQESLNDAAFYRDAIRSRFKLGLAGLRERAMAERYFSYLVRTLSSREEPGDHARPDIYYGNFSLFQSLPDTWAIDQLFPIMPLHRLGEEPDREGIFADITCDCDGKIDRFFGVDGVTTSLPLHRFSPGEPYYIGVFLVGAYQETLGDLHNLFGDTNVVSVSIDDQGRRVYGHEVEGDTVADVLSYVEFDPKDLTARFRSLAEQAVREGRITAEQRKVVMSAYTEGMRGYTYFEAE